MSNTEIKQTTAEDFQVSKNIARLRKEKGISQTKLAVLMREEGANNWWQNTVSRVERGVQDVTVGELQCLIRILGEGVTEGVILPLRQQAGGYFWALAPEATTKRIAQFAAHDCMAASGDLLDVACMEPDATIADKLVGIEKQLKDALDFVKQLRAHYPKDLEEN